MSRKHYHVSVFAVILLSLATVGCGTAPATSSQEHEAKESEPAAGNEAPQLSESSDTSSNAATTSDAGNSDTGNEEPTASSDPAAASASEENASATGDGGSAKEDPSQAPPEPEIELNAPERTSSESTGNHQGSTDADRFAELETKIAAFQVPPTWLSEVTPKWDIQKPWKEGRIEIRRLLGLNDEQARREAIKLTWDYLQKKDIGDGHEYGMYMFLGNEPIWAIIAFREYVSRDDLTYPPYFGLNGLASIYTKHGAYSEAEKQLKRGLGMSPPKAAWKEMRQAEMHDALGDLYAAWGKRSLAIEHYEAAIKLFPQAKPPYGRHLLPRRAKKVQSKLNLLAAGSLAEASLRDGQYRDKALGYSGDINLTVKIEAGRITDINVRHQEKIDQNACRLIPQRIIEKQSLNVDGVTGATVTKDAIVGGTLRALKQAGL